MRASPPILAGRRADVQAFGRSGFWPARSRPVEADRGSGALLLFLDLSRDDPADSAGKAVVEARLLGHDGIAQRIVARIAPAAGDGRSAVSVAGQSLPFAPLVAGRPDSCRAWLIFFKVGAGTAAAAGHFPAFNLPIAAPAAKHGSPRSNLLRPAPQLPCGPRPLQSETRVIHVHASRILP